MPKLLDQVREVIRMKHYSIRTEQAYVKRIVTSSFTTNGFGADMAEPETIAFISDLASKKKYRFAQGGVSSPL
jgi:hypothetical protein